MKFIKKINRFLNILKEIDSIYENIELMSGQIFEAKHNYKFKIFDIVKIDKKKYKKTNWTEIKEEFNWIVLYPKVKYAIGQCVYFKEYVLKNQVTEERITIPEEYLVKQKTFYYN